MSNHFVEINTVYEGGLRCVAMHAPSGTTLITDPPVDNQGKGESFSPTDLVAAALGSCMGTIMGIFAERHSIDLRGMGIRVRKEMIATPVRRIGRLSVEIRVPLPKDHPHSEALQRAALSCPVHQSVHPDIAMPVEFIWEN